ncbi:MAG TPA: hypothetical protein VFQ63_01590 [Patescibacteria group bacterium]|nr:hypothetical protein [Patescibacteria group bacterium]
MADRERLHGSPTLAEVANSSFDNPDVYHRMHASGLGGGDCFANTQRLIHAAQNAGVDLSHVETVDMWYEPIEPHFLVVANDMLRSEEDKQPHGHTQWNEHAFLVERRVGQNPRVYDLSNLRDNMGMDMKTYLERLLEWELTYNYEARRQVQLVSVPASQFVDLKFPNRYELGKEFRQETLGQVLDNY